jgi:hypothetical protein
MTFADYQAAMLARVGAHAVREQEKADEAKAAKQRALDEAAAYMAGLNTDAA